MSKKDPVIAHLRYLMDSAISLKEDIDKSRSHEQILLSLEKYERELKRLVEICPEEILRGKDLLRHSSFVRRYINKNDLESCYNDLQQICREDIVSVQDAYIENGFLTPEKTAEIINWNLIHPAIQKVSKKRFQDGHIADSVESAFKELNDIIKKRFKSVSGKELDGDSLMKHVFGTNESKIPPCIFKLADISTSNGKNIQLGYMEIFAGAMKGIRNPKAHANLDVDWEEGWEMIVLASHLMRMWEKYNK